MCVRMEMCLYVSVVENTTKESGCLVMRKGTKTRERQKDYATGKERGTEQTNAIAAYGVATTRRERERGWGCVVLCFLFSVSVLLNLRRKAADMQECVKRRGQG